MLIRVVYLVNVFTFLFLGVRSQVAFTAGNIVVYRVGAGASNLGSTASPVYLDEYTPAGVLVQSIAMPVTTSGSNKMLTAAGNGSTEGTLSLSGDGQFVILTGYNVAAGTASIGGSSSATRHRTIGIVKYDGTINTSTALTDLSSGGPVRSATTSNGTDLWACGAGSSGGSGGVRYTTLGSSTSSQITAAGGPSQLRCVCISMGQLFVTGNGNSPRIGTIGTGLPTGTGQVVTNLPGLPTNIDPGQFVMLDINPAVSGNDVLYYTDDGVGIVKYSLVSGTWVSNGTVGNNADDYRGLAAQVSGSTVILFATRSGLNSPAIEGGELVKITDGSGYNGAFSASPVVLASSITDRTAFRGVSTVPVQLVLPIKLVSFAAEKTNKDVKLKWTTEAAVNFSHFEVERSSNGMTFNNICNISVKPTGNFQQQYNYTDGAILNDATQTHAIFYRLKMVDIDGRSVYSKIVTVPLREKTSRSITVFPDPFIGQLFINGVQPGHITVSLFDMHGRKIKSINIAAGPEEQTLAFSGLETLPKGYYVLRIKENNTETSFRLIK